MRLTEYLDGGRGRAAALARAIGVRATQIGKWVSGERPIPEKRCVQIERATSGQVSRQELREDWHEIWPELLPAALGAGGEVQAADVAAAPAGSRSLAGGVGALDVGHEALR